VADELTLRRAEHAHVVDQDAIGVAHALIRVEEHHERRPASPSATFDQMRARTQQEQWREDDARTAFSN